jgi:hypothetical protein
MRASMQSAARVLVPSNERTVVANIQVRLDGDALRSTVLRIDNAYPIATSDVVYVPAGDVAAQPAGGSDLLRATMQVGRTVVDSADLGRETVALLDAAWHASTPALQHELTRLSEALLAAATPLRAHKKGQLDTRAL